MHRASLGPRMAAVGIVLLFLLPITARAEERWPVSHKGLLINLYKQPPNPTKKPKHNLTRKVTAAAKAMLQRKCVGTSPQRNGEGRDAPTFYGDLYFIRHPSLVAGLSRREKRVLTAAYISQDYETAAQIMAAIRSGARPELLWATNIVLLQMLARQQRLDTPEAKEILQTAVSNLTRAPKPVRADFAYFQAVYFLKRGAYSKAEKFLRKAIEFEPSYFNSHALLLEVLVVTSSVNRLGRRACSAKFGALVDALQAIRQLGPCPLQASHLASYLRTRLAFPKRKTSYLFVKSFLATLSGNRSAFIDTLENIRQHKHFSCFQEVWQSVQSLGRMIQSE